MADNLKEVTQEIRQSNEVMTDVRENTEMTSSYLRDVVDVFSSKINELVSFMRGNQLDQLEARREEQGPPGAGIGAADEDNYIQDIMDKITDLVDDALGIAGLTVGVIAAPFVIIGSFFSELRVQTQILNKFLGGGLGRFFSPITRFFEAIRNSKVITGLVKVWTGTVQPFFTRIGRFFGLLDDAGKAAGGFGKILRTAAKIGGMLGKIFYPITVLIGLFNAVTGFMDGYNEGGVLEGIKQGAIKAFDAIVGSFVRLLGSAVSFIFDILGFDNFAAAIKTQIDSVINGLYDSFGGLIDIIKGIFTLDLGMIKSGLTATFGGLVDIFTAPINLAYSAIKDLFSFAGVELPEINFGGFIKDTISSAFSWIKNQLGFSEGQMPSIIDIVTGLYTAPYDLVRSVASWVAGKLGFDQVSNLLSSFSFSDLLRDIVMAPLNLLRSAKDWILNQLGFDGEGMPSITDIILGILTAPANLLRSAANWLLSKFGLDEETIPDPTDIIMSIIKAPFRILEEIREWIAEKVSGFVKTVAKFIPGPIKSLLGINKNDEENDGDSEGIADKATSAVSSAAGFVGSLFGGNDDEEQIGAGSRPSRVDVGSQLEREGTQQRDAQREQAAARTATNGGGNTNISTNVQNNQQSIIRNRPGASSEPDNASDTMMVGWAP